MRISDTSYLPPPCALALILLLPTYASAASYDCSHIRVDRRSFDLSRIGGRHSVQVFDDSRPPGVRITTWSVDICRPLGRTKGVPKESECTAGTYVCGVEAIHNEAENSTTVGEVIPIAGSYVTSSGRTLDPKYERLKAKDPGTEGIRMELKGGKYNKRNQKAVIDFICDENRTGNEDRDSAEEDVERRRASDDDDEGFEDENKSLRFVGYGPDDDIDILRLDWFTKYACEDAPKGKDDDDDEKEAKSAGWGFFTWFIVIAFLGTAAYLIFGSWLNYNRYGARGWDLLPHGDALRDMPYILQDWWRKVMDTISGTGSRGGYSAV